jgi:hypothetical protein
MLFSQRYSHALEQSKLKVEIPDVARRKLWSWLAANNSSLYIKRDPNDNWISNSSILEETESELLTEHGWDRIPGAEAQQQSGDYFAALRHLVLHADAAFVFDAVELAGRWMEATERETLRQKPTRFSNYIIACGDFPTASFSSSTAILSALALHPLPMTS